MSKHIYILLFITILFCLFSTLYTVENSQYVIESYQNLEDYQFFHGDTLEMPTSAPIKLDNTCCNNNRDVIIIENTVPSEPIVEKEIIYQCPPEQEEEHEITCEMKCTIPTKCPDSEESDSYECRQPVPNPPPPPEPTYPPPPETLIPISSCPPQPPIKKVIINNFPEPECENVLEPDDPNCEA